MTKTDSSQQHSNSNDQLDIWSSILNQKNKDEASQSKPSPYIHPLVKKSKSYLSEKSLEICTESLGSETGSDGFSSSYTPSSSSSEDTNSEDDGKMKTCYSDDNPKLINNHSLKNKKKPWCIPPPLPSLGSQSQQLQMRSHRDHGRLFLFLQVVSVPSQNNFIATRQNGRLILTFAIHEEEEIIEEEESVIEQPNACSFELAGNKKVKSPKWSEKFNLVTNFKDVKLVQHDSLPRSLSLINTYQYYSRIKTTENVDSLILNDEENRNTNEVVVSGKMNIYHVFSQEVLVQNMKFCKDSRTTTSFLFWDPCCIAT
ncbi:protein FAF-like, chloroplastic [Vicia villosa]|uniref:protein FAF-like, chloroplastic n=1 Tax=Vicia villosa TaxID=3911 RepID=UPI00273C978B|nr:protein FAF-like, chloroplastic [Vicia villosa]